MRRRRAVGELAKARRATHPQKKVGKETLWGSLFTLDSSLGLRCLSASQPTLTHEEEEEEKKYCPPAAHVYCHQRRTCECVGAHACTSFGRGGQIPKALVKHPSHSSHKAPTHTRTPTSPPSPLPSIPSPAAEKSSVATHMWQLQPSFTSSQPVHGLRSPRQLLRLLRLLLLFLWQVKQAFIDRDGFPLGCFV